MAMILIKEHNFLILSILTGCPAQANAIPPHVADTITTTRSEINLHSSSTACKSKKSFY